MVRRAMGVALAGRMIAGLEEDATLAMRPLEPEIWTDYCQVTGRERASAVIRDFSQMLRDWLRARCRDNADLAASLRLAALSPPPQRPSTRALASDAS